MSWETLKVNRHYEIYNKYPYPIRRKSDHGVINSGIRVDGYQRVYLDKKEYLKHQVVATQWLPNPRKYLEIDHKNRHRNDNRLSNLKWTNRKGNNRNRKVPKHYKKWK